MSEEKKSLTYQEVHDMLMQQAKDAENARRRCAYNDYLEDYNMNRYDVDGKIIISAKFIDGKLHLDIENLTNKDIPFEILPFSYKHMTGRTGIAPAREPDKFEKIN